LPSWIARKGWWCSPGEESIHSSRKLFFHVQKAASSLEPVKASRRFALVFFFRDAFRERGFLAGSDEEEEDRLIRRLLRNAQTVKTFTK
jgi:hypothetical protein